MHPDWNILWTITQWSLFVLIALGIVAIVAVIGFLVFNFFKGMFGKGKKKN